MGYAHLSQSSGMMTEEVLREDPWEGRWVYGRMEGEGKRVAHIVKGGLPDLGFVGAVTGLCCMKVDSLSPLARPYPICKDCIRVAKETGLW